MVLNARVVRNVDGLDLPLFEKTLEVRRRFEEKEEREKTKGNVKVKYEGGV